MPDLDAIRARLGLCCYTCHEFVMSRAIDTCAYCGLSEWIHHYKRHVAALLAALDAKAQQEADRENRSNKESAKIPCPKCHGSGFTGRGSGYDDVCDCTGGYIGYVETQEKDG